MPPLVRKEVSGSASKPGGAVKGKHPEGSVLSRISNMDVSKRLLMSVYGEHGTGKTTFWSTFPGPILAILCSGVRKSGELKSVDTKENRAKIQTIDLWKPMDEIPEISKAIQSGKLRYSTIVIDHCTGMQDLVLRDILDVEELPQQRSWGMASREQWQQCNSQMKELLKMIADCEDSNVVFIAQEKEDKPKEDETPKDLDNDDIIIPRIGAALTPGVAGWLNYTCDYVCSTFIRRKIETRQETEEINGKKITSTVTKDTGKNEFAMRIGHYRHFTTKFRVSKALQNPLPKAIVDPTYEKVFKLITERQ